MEKKFWQSSNFWTWVALLIGSLVIGFGEIETTVVAGIASLFAVFGGIKIVHNFVKKGVAFDWKQAGSSNFWGYIALIANAIFVNVIPEELFEHLQNVVENLIAGNWQGAVGSVLPIIIILINLLGKKNQTPSEPVPDAT